MPYRSIEDQRAAQRRHYDNHPGYYSERRRIRRTALRTWVSDYKRERGCSRCDEHHPACLDFHHRDRADKEDCVSLMVEATRSRAVILAEIAKCDLLCSNCHRKEHAAR
jgi:hypothetical protein